MGLKLGREERRRSNQTRTGFKVNVSQERAHTRTHTHTGFPTNLNLLTDIHTVMWGRPHTPHHHRQPDKQDDLGTHTHTHLRVRHESLSASR